MGPNPMFSTTYLLSDTVVAKFGPRVHEGEAMTLEFLATLSLRLQVPRVYRHFRDVETEWCCILMQHIPGVTLDEFLASETCGARERALLVQDLGGFVKVLREQTRGAIGSIMTLSTNLEIPTLRTGSASTSTSPGNRDKGKGKERGKDKGEDNAEAMRAPRPVLGVVRDSFFSGCSITQDFLISYKPSLSPLHATPFSPLSPYSASTIRFMPSFMPPVVAEYKGPFSKEMDFVHGLAKCVGRRGSWTAETRAVVHLVCKTLGCNRPKNYWYHQHCGGHGQGASTTSSLYAVQGQANSLIARGVTANGGAYYSWGNPCDSCQAGNFVLTHGNLEPTNILVGAADGRLAAVVDWDEAGFYPEYWEYAKAAMWNNDFFGECLMREVLTPFDNELSALLLAKNIIW